MSAPQVLLIDDDEDMGFLLIAYAKKARFDIEQRLDAESGLARAAEAIPDVIVLDLGLPGMTGVEVLGQLKASADTQDIPVLVMTGNESPTLRQEALDAGAREVLIKPMTRDGFIAKIEAVLETT